MTGEQKEALRRYISGLPADERNRIKIINE
jgi:hypothetical protein